MIEQKEVIFHCVSCADSNKQLLGEKGFIEKQTKFESFSEAWEHMVEHREHYMIAAVDEE